MKKNHLTRKLLSLTLSLLLLVCALTGCGASSDSSAEQASDSASTATFRTLDEIKESGKIIIGVFSDKAPFGYVDENGAYQGYDVYFAERIAQGLNGKTLIVAKGTTAETYFEENYPDVELQKYDQYADAYNALLDGRGDAFSTDNTEVLAWALSNPGFTVGIDSLGDIDTIAPAVQKGNTTLLDWINSEIQSLAAEQFFHADYEATLAPVSGIPTVPTSSGRECR